MYVENEKKFDSKKVSDVWDDLIIALSKIGMSCEIFSPEVKEDE